MLKGDIVRAITMRDYHRNGDYQLVCPDIKQMSAQVSAQVETSNYIVRVTAKCHIERPMLVIDNDNHKINF